MTAYTITIFGRNDLGYPITSNLYVDAETPADTIMEPDMGWEVRVHRHDEAGHVCAYRIDQPQRSGLMVERSSTDLSLWMISRDGVGDWLGTIRES